MKIGELIKKTKTPFVSLEFFPPAKEEQIPDFLDTVDRLAKFNPLFVSVTYGAGGNRPQNTLKITKALKDKNLEVMPHLTCIGASKAGIGEYLDKLRSIGINNILALRGDPPVNEEWKGKDGNFRYASDLVNFVSNDYNDFGIGVAAYPFPHPESETFEKDREFTAKKLQSGADFAITQLFFDVREYVDLVERLVKRSIMVPVIPGIMTIQNINSLRRILSLCGAQIPAKFYLELEEAHNSGNPEKVREMGIKFAINQIHKLIEYGAPGVHLYTLNKSDICERIIKETL